MKRVAQAIISLILVIISLQVCLIILLAWNLCPRILESQLMSLLRNIDPKQLKGKPEIQLAVNVATQVIIPAVKDLNSEAKLESAHRRLIQTRILDLIDGCPIEQRSDLLKTLQKQEYDGVVHIVDAIFGGYEDMINAMSKGFVQAMTVEKCEPNHIYVNLNTRSE